MPYDHTQQRNVYYDLAPDHIARIYLDYRGWQYVYIREAGPKWVRFVPLIHRARSEKMLRARFDERADDYSVMPARPGDLERWQGVTSAWVTPPEECPEEEDQPSGQPE
jgi:hypothetical protein